jgi:hypothetical protein
MTENKSLAIIYGSVVGKIWGNNQNFLTIYHTLCSTYIASYLGFVFLVETSVLLSANDVEIFACAFIYCKCMLVISKPFVLAEIWKQIWKAQGLVRISYAICLDPSPVFLREASARTRPMHRKFTQLLFSVNVAQFWKQIWKAQGLVRISYATCLICLLYFTTEGLLNAPDA